MGIFDEIRDRQLNRWAYHMSALAINGDGIAGEVLFEIERELARRIEHDVEQKPDQPVRS